MDKDRLIKFLDKMLEVKISTGGILAVKAVANTSPYDWDASEGDNSDGSRVVLLPVRIPAKMVKYAEIVVKGTNENIDNVLRDLVTVIGHTGILTLAMDHIINREQPHDATDKH